MEVWKHPNKRVSCLVERTLSKSELDCNFYQTQKTKSLFQTFQAALTNSISKSYKHNPPALLWPDNGQLVPALRHTSETVHTHECLHWRFLDGTGVKAVWYPAPRPLLSLIPERVSHFSVYSQAPSLCSIDMFFHSLHSLEKYSLPPRPLSFTKPWIRMLCASFL